MNRYSGVYIVGGAVRNMEFEADDEADAKSRAVQWGVGLTGPAASRDRAAPPVPEAFDLKDTCRLLGNVSRATIYRWLARGLLERVKDTEKVLITRKSIERKAA